MKIYKYLFFTIISLIVISCKFGESSEGTTETNHEITKTTDINLGKQVEGKMTEPESINPTRVEHRCDKDITELKRIVLSYSLGRKASSHMQHYNQNGNYRQTRHSRACQSSFPVCTEEVNKFPIPAKQLVHIEELETSGYLAVSMQVDSKGKGFGFIDVNSSENYNLKEMVFFNSTDPCYDYELSVIVDRSINNRIIPVKLDKNLDPDFEIEIGARIDLNFIGIGIGFINKDTEGVPIVSSKICRIVVTS